MEGVGVGKVLSPHVSEYTGRLQPMANYVNSGHISVYLGLQDFSGDGTKVISAERGKKPIPVNLLPNRQKNKCTT